MSKEPNILELQAEYADICKQEKQITSAKAKVKAAIEALAPTEDPQEVDKWNALYGKTPYGSFKLVSKKTWLYSPVVDRLDEDLKILKIEEQENGTAIATENFGLRFVATE